MKDVKVLVDELINGYDPYFCKGKKLQISGESRFTAGLRRRCNKWKVPYVMTTCPDGDGPVVIDRESALYSLQYMKPGSDIDCGSRYPMSACAESVFRILSAVAGGERKLCGMNIVIIGRGFAVRGLSDILTCSDATVTVCHAKSKEIFLHTINADAVVFTSPAPVGAVYSEVPIVIDVSGKLTRCKELSSCYVPNTEVGRLTCAVLANRAARWEENDE